MAEQTTVTVVAPFAALENSFARNVPELHLEWQSASVPSPQLVVASHVLADKLGISNTALTSAEGVAILAGNAVPAGPAPTAMAYAGHQFGNYSPRLGDGRALLLGELVTDAGRLDLHLKGSGRTPFARGGDGKATLGPMLREFLLAEAMAALGIPTARALAVVATGEQVMRQDGPEAGAVLTRVAASHIRIGTFEYAARLEDPSVLRRLADHALARHHPQAAEAGDGRYLALLEAVVEAQASLVAQWMLVGFIHGVLNTDNVTISGETIDYGPCAFMDRYDPATVFSSIDHAGRYAYGNQPAIMQWNLTRFAETLLPLISDDQETAIAAAMDVLSRFPDRYGQHWLTGMAAKLGLTSAADDDRALVTDLLGMLATNGVDFTTAFRVLAESLRGRSALATMFADSTTLDAWLERWHKRLAVDETDHSAIAATMDAVNPVYIPRNHLVDEALVAAEAGDVGPFETLLRVVTHPYEVRDGLERFTGPAPEGWSEDFQTFCGT